MKILCMLLVTLLIGCGEAPRAIDGTSVYDVTPPPGKHLLVDMGYVEGTIQGKRLHAYRVVFSAALGGTGIDHIYILENGTDISIAQPQGKYTKKITVIVEKDTFNVSAK